MNMSHLIASSARRYRDRVAFDFNDQQRTYGEIDRRASRLARALQMIGVAQGDHIAILIGNRIEYAESEFAVARIGAVRVPFLIQSTTAELERWLVAAECRAVIVSQEAIEELRAARLQMARPIIVIAIGGAAKDEYDFEQLIASSDDNPVDVDIRPEDHYAIRFTGGTTGSPKGVVMNHRNMVTVVVNTVLNWPIDESDVGLHIHPLSHAAGMMMYAYWFVGARNVIRPAFRFDAKDFIRSVQTHKITSVFMIPTVLNVLLDAEALQAADASSIRTIVYGGAPIPRARLEQGIKRFGPVFLQVYGTSEAPFALTTLYPNEHELTALEAPTRLSSAGREIKNVEIKVADEDGAKVRPGVVGEVFARGDNNMVGYWKNPELTAKRLVNGWVRTGDMGYLDDDGYLHIVDRKDDLIITGGFNVWPAEIEDHLCRHPAVREAVIFGLEDPKWGEAVTGVVVVKALDDANESELLAFMSERLAKYKVPKRVLIRTEPLPKSPVGKLLRRVARAEFIEAMKSSAGA